MGKKTHEEEQREAHYQRELGKRGHSTGSAANTHGLQDYQARQAKQKSDQRFDSDFKKAVQTGGSGGCSLLMVASISLLILIIAGIGPSLLLW